MEQKGIELINTEIKAINIGIDSFLDSLQQQGVQVIHVDWRPPAGGDNEMTDILASLDML